ncbi:MAG TPA: Sec7 domain-containing protein [Gammaproteobacteria bacterium]|nr:Sec7 domain-containing protein [Gammaproteobacteria bacterium]
MAISPSNFKECFEIFCSAIEEIRLEMSHKGIIESFARAQLIGQLEAMKRALAENKSFDEVAAKIEMEKMVGEFIVTCNQDFAAKVDAQRTLSAKHELIAKQNLTLLGIHRKLGRAIEAVEKIEPKSSGFFKKLLKKISNSFEKIFKTSNQKTKKNKQQYLMALYVRHAAVAKEQYRESLESTELVTQKKLLNQKKYLISAFNANPKTAITILEPNTAENIAKFLHSLEIDGVKLDKDKIGEYLGSLDTQIPNPGKDPKIESENQKNKKILEQFAQGFNFKDEQGQDKALVPSLRQFLDKFRLPGESQKIERLLDGFAKAFFETGENAAKLGFKNEGTVLILAYAILQLNTDLYNPQVRKKMTEDQFIRNLRGTNDGKDFNQTVLSHIYHEIKGNEIKLEAGASKPKLKNR